MCLLPELSFGLAIYCLLACSVLAIGAPVYDLLATRVFATKPPDQLCFHLSISQLWEEMSRDEFKLLALTVPLLCDER